MATSYYSFTEAGLLDAKTLVGAIRESDPRATPCAVALAAYLESSTGIRFLLIHVGKTCAIKKKTVGYAVCAETYDYRHDRQILCVSDLYIEQGHESARPPLVKKLQRIAKATGCFALQLEIRNQVHAFGICHPIEAADFFERAVVVIEIPRSITT